MNKKKSFRHFSRTSAPRPFAKTVQQKKNATLSSLKKTWLMLTALSVLTFVSFKPSLQCGFTNWDDGTYITQNPMIWKLDAETLKEIFATPVSLNYHPLTMLSLAIDYQIDKLNPYYYHLNNLLLHILNTFLVFFFVSRLITLWNTKTDISFRPKPFWAAIITAVFFGIHPMHVESVTWVAERKDVLYVFFFLLSAIFYLRYREQKKSAWIILCFVFFVCSCLSKAMGVVLPLVLVLLDWFLEESVTLRKISISAVKKIPFFLVSLAVGIVAFRIQSQGAIAAMETFTLFQRLTFACYGFLMYLWKMFLPLNLSAFYPYPFTDEYGNVPAIYYISPGIVFLLAGVIIILALRKKPFVQMLTFGFVFYFVTVALVLQFISVGSAIMADRYSYLPYVGSFFVIGCMAEYLKKFFPFYAKIFFIILTGAVAYFSYLTHERSKVWTNAETLWTDAMNQFPFIEIAYENRGVFYKDKFEQTGDKQWLDRMLKDYEFVTQKLNSKNEKIWSNLGNLYGLLGQQKGTAYFQKSLAAYFRAIELNPNNASTYLNRAITYSMMEQYSKSLPDYAKSIELAPNEALTYKNRAWTFLQLGEYDASIADYDKALQLYRYDTASFQNRGIAKFNAKKFEHALADFLLYLSMKPNDAQTLYNASLAAKNLNRFSEALQYAEKAAALKFPLPYNYLEELRLKLKEKQK